MDHLAALPGLRSLARALARGDADADDLVQDAAVDALEHPPPADRPVGPWFVVVLRNRWRMRARADARRAAREAAALPAGDAVDPGDAIDRVRVLQRLGEALAALDEPYRSTIVMRYLDDRSCAQIARTLGVPEATVRSRLKRGLDRLRAALDETAPRATWQRALVPAWALHATKGAAIVTTKTKLAAAIVLIIAALATWQLARRDADPHAAAGPAPPATAPARAAKAPARAPIALARRAFVEQVAASGGVLAGRVVNWSTGDGVAGAELAFAGDGGAITVRSDDAGDFELAPAKPGAYTLIAIASAGFLPYAPELSHSPVRAHLAPGTAVRGVRLFLYPALDYHGRVVDERGEPVAGAHAHLLGTPEQAIDRLPSEWTTDRDGRFTFHAPDLAVIEASAGARRGWASVDGKVTISKQLVVVLGDAPPRDRAIAGRVIDDDGQPPGDVLVTATPAPTRAGSTRIGDSTTTAADGTFRIDRLDGDAYDLAAEADDRAPTVARAIAGGTRDVKIVLAAGLAIDGTVATPSGAPVPSFTLEVLRRDGALREIVATRSIADATGRFAIRVPPGSYELVASAFGWAPSPRVVAAAGARGVAVVVGAGAIVRGVVTSAVGREPIAYARVAYESIGGGASAQPANTGTVTRRDGAFELAGVPAGPLSLSISADGFHQRIEGSLVARDGGELGPLTIELAPLVDGEQPKIELVGVGVHLVAERDGLRVDRVIDGGGAQSAGIVVGDRITAVDGAAAAELGLDGAIARIRGVAGTTVALTVQRGDATLAFQVERRKLRA